MQKRDGKVTILASLFVFCLIPNAFAQKVLVNIWDGTEWEKVQSLYNAGKLPNAKRVGGRSID